MVVVECDVEKLTRILQSCMISMVMLIQSKPLVARDLSPILPLPPGGSEVPFIAETLRDPEVEAQRLTDDLYAQRAFEEANALVSELNTAQGNRRLDILQDLYKIEAKKAAFFEDILASRVSVQGTYGNVQSELMKARRAVQRYASEFVRGSKDRRAQARAVYHTQASQYLIGESISENSLQKIQPQLNKALEARARFLVALAQGGRNQKELQALSQSLGTYGRISVPLLLAKREGPNLRTRILQAGRQTRGMARNDREKVLAYGINLWLAKEGRRAQWSQAPIDLNAHKDLSLARAVSERVVLQNSNRRNYSGAIRYYRGLLDNMKGQAQLVAITNRILDLEAAQAQAQKSFVSYEKTLIRFHEFYQNSSILGSGQETLVSEVQDQVKARHRRLVSQQLALGKSARISRVQRSDAIRMGNTFLEGFASDAEKVGLKADIARLYVLNEQHAKAVSYYMELKGQTQGQQSQQFLTLAMQSQRVLAEWPERAPWQGVIKEKGAERQALLKMYEERVASTKSWDDLAHVGLLNIQLGQGTRAFEIWTDGLEKNPQGPQAQLASGMMLSSYRSGRQWQKLEDLSRLNIKARMVPVFQGQRLDAVALLGDALFEGGKEHFVGSRFGNASQKLAEFVRAYRSDRRRPEGLFVLGKSYHMDQKHPQSVETLYALVNEYPSSAYDREALLLGGSWSMPMAWEDQTIFFYQRFADKYGRDGKAPGVRMTLVQLYMGREHYGNAVRAHAAQTNDPQVSRAQQIESALAVMHIEERYGEPRHAIWGATKAKDLSGQNPIVVAEVLAFEARQAAAANNLTRIQQIEAQLSSIGLSDRTVIEALALTRLMLAEKQATLTKQDIFNLEQTDPYQTLQAQYGVFLKTKASYEKVCAPGPSSYCGLAMLRLSETTRLSLSSIENLTIAQTLEESQVRRFDQQKLAIIATITQTAAKADTVALGISEQGETIPEWSQEIVVNNSDASLDRSHGAIGNGYVQWLPVRADR
jgi:TolA-binding protein